MEKSSGSDSNSTVQDYMFGKGQAVFILVVTSLLYMVNMMDRQVFSVAQEPMRLALGLNDTQMGIIQTCFVMGMALFSLPIAYLVDRWSRKKSIGIMALLWSGFTFLTGLGNNFLTILLPRIFTGVGEAGFTSGGTPLITAAFPQRLRATVLAVFNVISGLGVIIGMVLGGYLVVKYNSWSAPFFFFAIPGIILGVIAFFLKDYKKAPRANQEQVKTESFFQSAISLLKIPSLLRLYVGYAMMQVMFMSIMAWIPTFLMRAQNIKADQAGLLIGLIGLLTLVGNIAGGIVADKWQKKNARARMLVPALAVSTCTIFIIAAIFLNVQGVGFAIACIYGLLYGIGIPAITAATQDVAPVEKRGQAWGMNVLLQYVLGGGWAPLVVGILSDQMGAGAGGLKIALIITSSFGIIAGILYFYSARHYPQDVARANGSIA